MEYFLWSCAQWSILEKYKNFLKIDVENVQIREATFDAILTACVTRFVGWLLYHVGSVGTLGRSQLFYISFLNHYYGLSRDGLDINGRFGFGVTTDMFDKLRAQHEHKGKTRLSAKLKLPHVSWWDNFSKFHAHSIPSLQKNVFSSCLWTGVTVNEYQGPEIDMSIEIDDNGDLVQAMPDDLFSHQARTDEGISGIFDEGPQYYDNSLVKKYDVASIPLTIDVKQFPEMKNQILSSKNTTQFIHPHKLVKVNIGSNRGLLSLLRSLQEDEKMHRPGMCEKYKCINVDENIYYRILKVHYFYLFTSYIDSQKIHIHVVLNCLSNKKVALGGTLKFPLKKPVWEVHF